MAGPTQRAVVQVRISGGQAEVQYAPTNLAHKVKNLELTPERTLRAVRGACLYEPDRGGNQYLNVSAAGIPRRSELPDGFVMYSRERLPPTIYGLYHAGLLRGRAPTLVVRAGTKLYLHAGWRRSWKVIYEGLTDDGRAGYPDMFTVVNDQIVWTNGIDQPLSITHDGMVVPLGFSSTPGAPEVLGPLQPVNADEYPNSDGYSWPGRIGTIGDFVDNNDGAVLDGRWRYAVAWEDIHGNISALSPSSSDVTIRTQRANYTVFPAQQNTTDTKPGLPLEVDLSTPVDELPRQFAVKSSGNAPEHAIACRLYRTPDTNRLPNQLQTVVRIAGAANFTYADNVPDSRLGAPSTMNVPVPVFDVMTSHAGALVVGAGPTVLRSEVGFPGSFPSDLVVTPDPDGATVTAVASHNNQLLAFTERSVVDITDPNAPPRVLARGIGCVAPRSLQGLPDGTLIWLSRDAFYGWRADKGLMKISDPIHRLVKSELATGSLRNAVSIIEPVSREYRCAVPKAGEFDNTLLLCFDGEGWRQVELGYKINDMCVTDDPRYLVLFAGGQPRTITTEEEGVSTATPTATNETVNIEYTFSPGLQRKRNVDVYDVYVMSHETVAEEQPERTYEYKSAWLRGDDSALKPIHVHNLYIGMVDEVNELLDVNIFSNGSYAPDEDSPRKLRAVGVKVEDLLGDFKVGTGKVHTRRLFWRRVPVGLQSVNTWAFEIKSKQPFHIAAFAFQTSFATMGDELGRIPLGEDE
jgi:hypothetical protein